MEKIAAFALVLLISTTMTTFSCKHKNETGFNQNNSVGSESLTTAIRKYETLHSRCFSLGIVDDLLRPVHVVADMNCKYIYINIDQSGLGNRMMTLISFFLLGLLTDRAIILQSHEYKLDELFCQPFNGSEWNIPDTFNFNQITSQPWPNQHLKYGDDTLRLNWHRWADADFTEEPWLKDRQIWYIEQSELYLVPIFFLNSAFEEALLSWFPNYNVAAPLTQYLFHPQDTIWDQVITSYTNRDTSRVSLGIHMRWRDGNPLPANCLDAEFRNDMAPVDVFVASLIPYNDPNSPLLFWVKKQKLWTVYHKYHDFFEMHNQQQVITVIHDMWLLSITDRVILSGTSTFSYVIQALRNQPHQTMYLDPTHNSWENVHCIKMQSQEPCCHNCGNLVFSDHNQLDTSGRFMRCEDYARGAKLIVPVPKDVPDETML